MTNTTLTKLEKEIELENVRFELSELYADWHRIAYGQFSGNTDAERHMRDQNRHFQKAVAELHSLYSRLLHEQVLSWLK